jgi:hypothetical protein
MKVTIFISYVVFSCILFTTGHFYPQIKQSLFLAIGECGFHAILSSVVLFSKMSDAGRISAMFWQALSLMFTVILLLTAGLRQENGWLVGALFLNGFSLIVTISMVRWLKVGCETH